MKSNHFDSIQIPSFRLIMLVLGFSGIALSASGKGVKVVTANSAEDYQYRQDYVTWIGTGEDLFGLGELSAGSQTIHLNFEVQLELPDNLPSSRTLVARIGLGHKADYWAKSGNDAFFGIRLDPENAGVGVVEQSAGLTYKDGAFTSFAGKLSGASAKVSLEITTPDGFRTKGAEDELRYTCAMKVDFDRDGQADLTATGSFMDSRWGVNLWLGLERWWSGAGNTARQAPLKLHLNL